MRLNRLFTIAIIAIALTLPTFAADQKNHCDRAKAEACCKVDGCCVKDSGCAKDATCCTTAACCDHAKDNAKCATDKDGKTCCKTTCPVKKT